MEPKCIKCGRPAVCYRMDEVDRYDFCEEHGLEDIEVGLGAARSAINDTQHMLVQIRAAKADGG